MEKVNSCVANVLQVNSYLPSKDVDEYNRYVVDELHRSSPWLDNYKGASDERVPFISINPNYITYYKRKLGLVINDDHFWSDVGSSKKKINILSLFPAEVKAFNYNENFVHPKNLINKSDERSENLKENKINPYGSQKSTTRIKLAINWLAYISQKQKVYCDELKKNIPFTLNHFTLTLPVYQVKSYIFHSGKEIFINDKNRSFVAFPTCLKKINYNYTDRFIKHDLLNHFLTICRRDFHIDSYVWRAETQSNGNIHFHITTNKFVYLSDLRSAWNTVLSKTKMIQLYHEKFCKMSYEQYKAYRLSSGHPKLKDILRAYQYGRKTDWYDPNTTDIHAVWKIKNITAYLSTYFTKKAFCRRQVDGCLWRLSRLLSMLKKEVLFAVDEVGAELNYLWKHHASRVKCKEYASIFCFKIKDIANIIKDSVIVKKFVAYRNSVFENYNNQKQLNFSPGKLSSE
jgi:hypothetical protein